MQRYSASKRDLISIVVFIKVWICIKVHGLLTIKYLSKLFCNYESIIIQWTNNVNNEYLKNYSNLYYSLKLNLIKEPENTIKKEIIRRKRLLAFVSTCGSTQVNRRWALFLAFR